MGGELQQLKLRGPPFCCVRALFASARALCLTLKIILKYFGASESPAEHLKMCFCLPTPFDLDRFPQMQNRMDNGQSQCLGGHATLQPGVFSGPGSMCGVPWGLLFEQRVPHPK